MGGGPAGPAPPESPEVAVGRAVFLGTACVSCHRVRGTAADGTFGPDLTHLMSRTTIGAGVARNTAETCAGGSRTQRISSRASSCRP